MCPYKDPEKKKKHDKQYYLKNRKKILKRDREYYRKNIEKSYYEVKKGNAELVVMLIASRTDTRWFHKYIYKNPLATVRFIKGRVRYEGGKHPAPFPSMVVIFRRSI